MRRIRWLLLPLALAAGAPAFAQALPQPIGEPASAALLPATQALFDDYVKQGRVPGIVGAFGTGDLPTVFVAAGRIADEATAAPAGPDSLWRIYSMTKPVTAMAAMILIEEGKLRLDQPISDFFPAYKHMMVLTDPAHSLASRPAVREITVRNLLTHTAGLGYPVIVTTGPLNDAYMRAGLVPGALNTAMEQEVRPKRPASLAAFAEKLATLPLIADPGTRWSYSMGLDLLGAVIEKASGMPFDAFVQARILTPLGMRSTYWQVPASETGRLATNYLLAGGQRLVADGSSTSLFLQPPSFPYGGAGLVSSAADYDRFLHMLQDGGTLGGVRIMKPETVALAMSNLLPAGVTYGGVAGTTGGTQASAAMGYGAGGSVTLADTPGGLGKGSYAWGGAAGTIFWIDPVRHFRATVMVNYMPPDQWPLRTDLGRALLQDAKRFQ